MTRSIGDLVAKQVGVICDPEISTKQLRPKDKFVVLASDGIWDRIPNQEAMELVVPYFEKGGAQGAVNKLVEVATEKWQTEQGMIDDITVLVVFLNVSPAPSSE